MSDTPSYQQAHQQRIQDILESIKTEHPAPRQPVRTAETSSGLEDKYVPGSQHLEVK